jgi:ribulose-phosphate 3-epimerase
MQYRIAPSILSADFAHLADECQAVLDAGADWLHVDVMDGHFVPNISIGLPVVQALRKALPDAVLDVHIMVSDPGLYAEQFVQAGADYLSFHAEATPHLHRVISSIHAAGGKASLALCPGTPVEFIDHVLDRLDMVLLMSVDPGFGGQGFIPAVLPKIEAVRARAIERREDGATFPIQVDGGVGPANVGRIAEAGANVFVAGSAIFRADNYADAVTAMRTALNGSSIAT